MPDGQVLLFKVDGLTINVEAKELVLCKNCFFHGEFDENGYCVCENTGAGMPMDGFCSDGERRKEWMK